MGKHFIALAAVFLLGIAATAQAAGKEVHVKVGEVMREALVFAPASAGTTKAPVVFAFHGHGGSSKSAARDFDYQKHWPEAIVVYMQGQPIASNTDPEGKRAGWQHEVGQLDDRDLKFFDRMLARVKKDYAVDDRRIYAAGHSNGGGFTYLLWAARGEVFAAVAPSSASSANAYLSLLKPKPVLHVAGRKDNTAPFARQEKLMEAVRKLNGCDAHGKPWHQQGTRYASAGGTPFIELIHPGGHEFLDAAPRLIVHFFQEHPGK